MFVRRQITNGTSPRRHLNETTHNTQHKFLY